MRYLIASMVALLCLSSLAQANKLAELELTVQDAIVANLTGSAKSANDIRDCDFAPTPAGVDLAMSCIVDTEPDFSATTSAHICLVTLMKNTNGSFETKDIDCQSIDRQIM